MLKGLSIRAYLTLMVVLFGVVLLIGAAPGLLSLRESNASLQQMYTVDTPAVADLEGSAGQLLRLRLALATYSSLIELNDQEGADAVLKRFDTYQKVSNERLAHYISKASNDADEQRLIKDMQDKRDAFLHEGAEPALAALKSGDKAAFQQLQAHKLSPLYSAYEKAMLTLEKLQLDHAEQRYQEAQQLFYTISVAVAIGMAATLIFAWLGRMMMVRAIVHPVDATIEQFQRIANGDLTGRIDNVSDNEMGRLAAALRKMQESLIATVNTVRHGTDSIDTGVSEIAAGNTNLSQRTEEQAASLEETAASIEELTSTVKQTADNAKQASSLAQGASTLAAQGGDLTQQVVGTMQKIVDDSRRIADIVGVIEGIAFQTNILALNAAVEAARAGEQGRGFAVVASEVRSLAQRSAAAAKEIKGLIGESNGRVTAGADLVQRSGSTMTDIVDAIARVSAIMSEIAEAATEQSTGIDQVNLAVAQMDEVTQQNAALVEQAAAAASSLEEQARRLTTAVAVFRTDSGQASSSRGAARRVATQKQGVALQMEAVEAG
ncbi:methyl-accepting chemotaxis protein I [Paraburkholderia sp. PGU19]|uniref:methyl-accepting chemotaxis protein n=1 Tax=Paraburkholderia sp. PGU19 TaxID=2735434 RepID=UPI0015DB03E0|nr:methyl-accepting chemotaxis protein [Paraburkholderia sp. PGU19]BCF95791.1 methyl-accepting chemotaxis protein I [Paraburkholderia sp. PGU19]